MGSILNKANIRCRNMLCYYFMLVNILYWRRGLKPRIMPGEGDKIEPDVEAGGGIPATPAVPIHVGSLPNFNPGAGQLAESWTRWLRAFKLFLKSKNVTNDGQKVALL